MPRSSGSVPLLWRRDLTAFTMEIAGRACWVVTGTLCTGEIQGTFAKKFKNCSMCDFYEQVKKEEFPNFKLSAVLLRNLG
jgi:hypothetical protein